MMQVKRGVLYSPAEAEGRRKRNPFDTVTEGVGLNRLTNNFASARIDDAVQCSDQVLLPTDAPFYAGLCRESSSLPLEKQSYDLLSLNNPS